MASVSIQKRGAGRWRVRWREAPGAPERSRSFDRKADAESFRDGVRADLLRGVFIDPARGRQVTFGEFGVAFMAGQPWRALTARNVESMWRLHVAPTFGARPIGSIRTSELQQWVNGLGLGAASKQQAAVLVQSVFDAAVQDRLIPASPAAGLKLPKQVEAFVEPLTVAQVQSIAAAADESIGAAVLFGAMTGLRQGELFGLTGDRVDWLRREVTVDRQLVTTTNTRWEFGPPKTARSVRKVPVPDRGLEVLSAHVAEWGLGGGDGFVFHDNGGRPLHRGLAYQRFRRALLASGVAEKGGWHLLRHHCASVLIANGMGVTAVASLLGHSPAECFKTYARWWPSEDDQLRGALDRAWTPAEHGLRAVE